MNQLALELDINSAVDNIRDVVLELLNCERVTLFLVDNQQKELRCAFCCTASYQQAAMTSYLSSRCIAIFQHDYSCYTLKEGSCNSLDCVCFFPACKDIST